MAWPEPRTILITGASGSIGSALAREYAADGRRLVLQGRNEAKLSSVAKRCEARGAQVFTACLDLTDVEGARTWMRSLWQTHEPDLVVLNAGMNTDIGPGRHGEDWADSQKLVQLNLMGVMALAELVGREMRSRGGGQLALVSSLAGYFGLPVTPSYCASKAGIKAYGEALRGWLGPEGVKVSVIMPGYVSSPMCEAMPGPKPFLMRPERAARIIRRGLARNRARISFPFPLNLGTWFLAVLPAAFSTRLVGWMGYRG